MGQSSMGQNNLENHDRDQSDAFQFAFHALQIRDAMTEVEGWDRIAIGLKASIGTLRLFDFQLMLASKVLNCFDSRSLAHVGEQISDAVRSLCHEGCSATNASL